jgi:DHA1 family tetracycline resistance protein-like MFS transporter
VSTAARRERAPLPPGYLTLWTTVALDLVGFGIVVPILGRYAERFGANGLQVGLLFASFSLAQLLCAPLLGRLSDRIGRKPVIVVSLIGTAVGSFVTGAAGSLWLLFVGRLIDGASGGSLSVAQAAVADISSPEQRPKLVGMMGAAFGVGFVLGPAIGGLSALGGPHVPFYVAGVLAAANAIAAMVRLPETRPHTGRGRATDRASSGAHGFARPSLPVLRQLALVGFITTFAFAAFEATFSLFGDRRFGLNEGSAAAVFLGVGLVLVAIQGGLYGRIVERWGVGGTFRNGLIMVTIGLFLLAGAKSWPVLIVALILLAVGQGCASPSITSMVSDLAPVDQRGQALGFQQSAYGLARVIGPPIAGLLFDHAGVPSPYIGGALLCAVGVVLLVMWGLHRPVPVPAVH